MLATPDGARIVRAVASGSSSEPEEVARQLIARLYEAGAEEVLMAEQQ
jgi:porphobilinogen deaminase